MTERFITLDVSDAAARKIQIMETIHFPETFKAIKSNFTPSKHSPLSHLSTPSPFNFPNLKTKSERLQKIKTFTCTA
jgi:hypothetical protein